MKSLWRYAVTGNIKKTRIDENGILRYGTAAFKGNTKNVATNSNKTFVLCSYLILLLAMVCYNLPH